MLLCALLKSVKMFFLSTALFTSSGTLYKDPRGNTVAVSYSLHAPAHRVDSEITVIKDPAYRPCFETLKTDYHIYTPKTAIKIKTYNAPSNHTLPILKPLAPSAVKAGGFYRIRRPTIRQQLRKYHRVAKPKASPSPSPVRHNATLNSASVSRVAVPSPRPSPSQSVKSSSPSVVSSVRSPPPAPPSGVAKED